MVIDRAAPLTFLRTAFREGDSIAVFLKSYQSGRIAHFVNSGQAIDPFARLAFDEFEAGEA